MTGVFVGGPVLCACSASVCWVLGVSCVACCARGRECYVVCEWFSVSCLVCDHACYVMCNVCVLSCMCVFLSDLRILLVCHLCVLRVVWDINCVLCRICFVYRLRALHSVL